MSNNSSSSMLRSWLLFVEDPGAAVYVRFLPDALKSYGIDLRVLVAGHAKAYFEDCFLLEDINNGFVSSDNVFHQFQPELLIVGTSENPATFAFALCEEAKKRGIPSVGLVDSAANVSERFRGETHCALRYAPDWLVVPDLWTAKSFEKIGFSLERVLVAGHPRFDEIYDQRSKWTEADRLYQREQLFGIKDASQKVIVFVSEISTGLNHDQYQRSSNYTINGKSTSTGRTEIVIDEFLECVAELPFSPYLVLRLHPKQQSKDLLEYVQHFNFVSSAEPALEVVNASDLVVGMTSMLMQESALMGCATLSIVPKLEERCWLGSMADYIPCAWTKKQIKDILPKMLTIGCEGVDADLLPKRGSQENVAQFLVTQFPSKS